MSWLPWASVESGEFRCGSSALCRWLARVALLAGLLLSIATILLPVFAQGDSLPGRDSGVFLYTGQMILQGKLPYLDVWDHKGPAIHFINALGVWIAGGAQWGVWLIELCSLLSAIALSVWLFMDTAGPFASIMATVFWLVAIPLLLGHGNFTEEYALPLQFAALLLFYLGTKRSRSAMLFLLVGVAGGFASLLRPNTVGIWLAVGLYLAAGALKSDRRAINLKRLGFVLAGALVTVCATLLFFAVRGALPELVDATIIYNLAYSSATLARRLDAVRAGLMVTLYSGILLPAICAWLLSLVALLTAWRRRFRTEPLVVLAVIAFPIEILLTSVSGYIYNHYYLTWLPTLGLLTSHFFGHDLHAVIASRSEGKPRRAALAILVTVVCAVSILLLAIIAMLNLRQVVTYATAQTRDRSSAATSGRSDFPWKSDSPDQYLLMWGAATAYNYWLGIPSPTRYVYQFPLYHCTYTTEPMMDEFLADIVQHHPVIVDTAPTHAGVPPIDPARREEWIEVPQAGQRQPGECAFPSSFDKVFEYLDHNYIKAGTYGSAGWPVYVYAPGG